jgi:CTP synthase
MTKYIFVSGGFISGIGKGVTAAALGYLLKKHGYKVSIIKFENYLNLDCGRMHPTEHGDPYLTQDGAVTDMDLGTYARFLDQEMNGRNFVTMGQLYKTVIDREEKNGYAGQTVDATEGICSEIISRIDKVTREEECDIIIIELGGTIGEIPNQVYYETAKIMKLRYKMDIYQVHVAYVPFIPSLGEPKTKPVQLSVMEMIQNGIFPDLLVLRTEVPLDDRRIEKLVRSCNVPRENIIENRTLGSIYELPEYFEKQAMSKTLLKIMGLQPKDEINLSDINNIAKKVNKISSLQKSDLPTIAIVGKYFATGDYSLADSYAALIEAIKHAGIFHDIGINIKYINSEKLEGKIAEELKGVKGIIVPIGWGERGVEGKIEAIKYSRENKIPYLGLCYGMQLACVEWARNVLKLEDANSEEVDTNCKNKIIHSIPEDEKYQKVITKGVSMRIGGFDCVLKSGTIGEKIYGSNLINERHRHRFEFNNEYRKKFEESGFIFSGTSPDDFFVEMIELPKEIHPFFIATQAHPEYKSTPLNPHPIFVEFVKQVINLNSK